jgi:hypothetical protein
MLKKIEKVLKATPSLMAKEIAKKLGCKKDEINPILYAHQDKFEVDSEYRWKLKTEALRITFADQWVDCLSFEDSLSSANTDFDCTNTFIFIIPENCKFLIETIARFLALCNQLIDDSKEVTIDLSSNNSSKAYWNRAGFFDHLHDNVNVLPNRPKTSTAKSRKGNSETLVEFGAVDPKSDNRDLIKQLADTFVSLSSTNYEDPAFTIFSELIGNIKEHSESPIRGFAALQKYNGRTKTSSPHIQTIVSDSGVGIAATLRPTLKKYYPTLKDLSDIELVKKAMSEGQITKHGAASGHGLGFKSSKEKALKFNAKYSVRQSNFSLEFQFKNGILQPIKELPNLVKISGTHICFDFDIDDSACN